MATCRRLVVFEIPVPRPNFDRIHHAPPVLALVPLSSSWSTLLPWSPTTARRRRASSVGKPSLFSSSWYPKTKTDWNQGQSERNTKWCGESRKRERKVKKHSLFVRGDNHKIGGWSPTIQKFQKKSLARVLSTKMVRIVEWFVEEAQIWLLNSYTSRHRQSCIQVLAIFSK